MLESQARSSAERWKEQHPHPPLSIEELQRQGREAWLKLLNIPILSL